MPARIHGLLELHIEQGPVLDAQAIPVGLVTAIAGSFRYRQAICHGTYGHSGAVARAYRHDAVFAIADLITRLDALWAEIEAEGQRATITVGEFFTDPAMHAFAKVPGEVRFCLDVRSGNVATLARIENRLDDLVTARRGDRASLRVRLHAAHPAFARTVRARHRPGVRRKIRQPSRSDAADGEASQTGRLAGIRWHGGRHSRYRAMGRARARDGRSCCGAARWRATAAAGV
jgi:N-carbamoyl-L-amino-acid hydrolase